MSSRRYVDDEHSGNENDAAVLEALEQSLLGDFGPGMAAVDTTPAVQPAAPARKPEQLPPPRRRRRKLSWDSNTGIIGQKAEPRPIIRYVPQPEHGYRQHGDYGD